MKTKTKNEVSSIIRGVGFRATDTRKLVYSFLRKSKYPVNIKEIVDAIGADKIDQVTVYRILEAFSKVNLVQRIDFRQGHAYFELVDEKHDHHHIVCTKCNTIKDFYGCNFGKFAKDALKKVKGFSKITGHSLEFFGVCNSCVKIKILN